MHTVLPTAGQRLLAEKRLPGGQQSKAECKDKSTGNNRCSAAILPTMLLLLLLRCYTLTGIVSTQLELNNMIITPLHVKAHQVSL